MSAPRDASGFDRRQGVLHCGGVPVEDVAARVRARWSGIDAFYLYDADAISARARRFQAAFRPLSPHVAFAIKANPLPWLLAHLARLGLGADVVSLGEMYLAEKAGFAARSCVVNGNGKSNAELDWALDHPPHSINVDSVDELQSLAGRARVRASVVRVALRINPGIDSEGHRYVATGTPDAKFGMGPETAAAMLGRARELAPLRVDGIHLHVGSQMLDPGPLELALDWALAFRERARGRGADVSLVNLGGGFGIDYAEGRAEFPLEAYAARWAERVAGLGVEWVLEPGRWLVAPAACLIARVLWVKSEGARRTIVLAAGMNDLLRPALYGARHAIEPLSPRGGDPRAADVVGPVCESTDTFATGVPLPPLQTGDLVAIRDAGAYGAVMSSQYNGRGRLAELVLDRGTLRIARPAVPAAPAGGMPAEEPLAW